MFTRVEDANLKREGYWICQWDDETSQFDPKGQWIGGLECYQRTYRMWIPNYITEDDTTVLDRYIEIHQDDPETWYDHNAWEFHV